MIYVKPLIKWVFMLLLSGQVVQAEVLYELDFSKASGDVKTWFKDRGWSFHHKIHKMNPRFDNGMLVLEARNSDSGAIIYKFPKKDVLVRAKHIVIEWGVEQYPAGASWEGPIDQYRNTRDPINVMISFGTEKVGSGSFIVPAVPYFIGLFPAAGDIEEKAYYGNYWQRGGRYFCISGTGSTDPLTTHFALADKFKETFNKDVPPVTALTIGVDAKNTTPLNGCHSKAYIRKIIILDEFPET